MRFAAVTLGVGLAGTLVSAGLSAGSPSITGDVPATVIVDPTVTGGIAAAAAPARGPDAVRLIDLKAGASCRAAAPPAGNNGALAAAPLAADCARSPSLSRIAYWRSEPDGSLVMADSGGRRVLQFAPGDGVMFESVYPANELITIVPARS